MASWRSPISSSRSPRRSTSCSTSTTRSAAAEARREGARRRAAKCEAEEAKREAEKAKREAQEAKRNAEAEAEAEERRASMRARVDALLTALARARVLEGRVQQQALAEGAWLLHCWGRAKSAAPVLLRVHVKLTGLQGRLLRSEEGQVGAAARSSLGGQQCRGRLTSRNTQSRASAGLLWRLSCSAVRGLAGVIEMAAEHGERRAGQLEAARGRGGRNKYTYVFFN